MKTMAGKKVVKKAVKKTQASPTKRKVSPTGTTGSEKTKRVRFSMRVELSRYSVAEVPGNVTDGELKIIARKLVEDSGAKLLSYEVESLSESEGYPAMCTARRKGAGWLIADDKDEWEDDEEEEDDE